VIAVALAGGAGAALRFIVDGIIRSVLGDRLPWGTLLVNVTGSLALGWLVGGEASRTWLDVAGVAFLGGFTTFSAASFETARLAMEGRSLASLGYGLGTLAICVCAAALGYFLAASIAS
jgi:CrcB protein